MAIGQGAWRVTEDFTIPGVDEFRLRSSYGTAGLRPQYDDQYEILTVTPGGFTKQILGNPLLKPARSAELEVGTNLEFGGGRYSVEYTFARKNTKDQILLVDLPAVAGFTQQWQNTGALESKTHELTFATQLINTASTSSRVSPSPNSRVLAAPRPAFHHTIRFVVGAESSGSLRDQ